MLFQTTEAAEAKTMSVATVQVRAGILGAARKTAGVKSDDKFAAMLGVSRETLRLVENGERDPSNVFIAGLQIATRRPFNELFKLVA